MDIENFKKAKELTENIKTMNEHIDKVQSIVYKRDGSYYENTRLLVSDCTHESNLIHHFIPISTKEFMMIYLERCKNRIKELEEEFAKL